MWSITFDMNYQSDFNINRTALGFSEILKGEKMMLKLSYIDKLAVNIKNNKIAYLSIKVLSRIFKLSFENGKKLDQSFTDI